MKQKIITLCLLIILLSGEVFSQTNSQSNNSEKVEADSVASLYLNLSARGQAVPSSIIDSTSLNKAKEDLDSSLKSDSSKPMTPSQTWDYFNKKYAAEDRLDLNIKWHILGIDIKKDSAFITYKANGRPRKVMKLKKEDNKWEVILSFKSIF